MVGIFEAALLGFVQGITEWLPVSSSGHLVILQHILGIQMPIVFDVFLHFGSLLAIVVFFRKEIWNFAQPFARLDFMANGRTALYVVIGTVPVAIAGLLFHDLFAASFNNLHDVGVLMVLMGFILFNTRWMKGEKKLGLSDALWMGIAQAAALAPGISRSGTTISMGLMRKVRKEQAFVFSFMLSIPAILGANAYEFYKAGFDLSGISVEMIAGVAVAAVVGYVTLDMLRRIVLSGRLHMFAYYCWAVGFTIVLYTLFFL
jgi:undecaprenyl-diphosphatase